MVRCVRRFATRQAVRTQVNVLRPGELGPDHLSAWRSIQESQACLHSPFFSPEFVFAVAAERDDVFVAVLERDNGIEGFFAFHRDAEGVGIPVGVRISDHQGLVARDCGHLCAPDLLRACGLQRLDFRCVPASQKPFQLYHARTLRTLAIDLPGGFEAYAAWLKDSGSHLLTRLRKMQRQVEQSEGPTRFIWHAADSESLSRLLECKSGQYRRTGQADLFAQPWIVRTLQRLHAAQDAACRGVLSELRAGDRLLAAHFGIRSRTVLHYWFPCYESCFARHSPGLLLLLEIVKQTGSEGISRIDLGFANAPYKERFANANDVVARGSVTAAL
jgi:CelD/BcsL family acetyltransferase involved in cellulose biosynthesis